MNRIKSNTLIFSELFPKESCKRILINKAFIDLLELVSIGLLKIKQDESYGPIVVIAKI